MLRILLVEDNEMNRDMLSRRLQRRGYSVAIAEDGERGLTMACAQMPDLILMDVWLPFKNGTAAAREIRALPECAHIPIIRLSALDEPHNAQGQPESFAWDATLTKPVQFDLLEAAIRRLLSSSAAEAKRLADDADY